MTIHKLLPRDAVEPGYLKMFEVGGRSVLLACGEKGPVALYNACPHAGSPLHDGKILGHRLRCPRHGYIFDLETGTCARGRREGFGGLTFITLTEVDDCLAVEI